MEYRFEWDLEKQRENWRNHGVGFEQAATVFRDPSALSLYASRLNIRNEDMKKEYDFSKAERGKFYRPDATFNLPVYLEEDNRAFVQGIAQRKGTDVSSVVNDLIRSDQRIAQVLE